MLTVHETAEERLEEVREFARANGLLEQLESRLEYLGSYACQDDPEHTKCVLYHDFAPYSFVFTMLVRKGDDYEPWFNGGLIYQGPTHPADGTTPSFTVSLHNDIGWFVHT